MSYDSISSLNECDLYSSMFTENQSSTSQEFTMLKHVIKFEAEEDDCTIVCIEINGIKFSLKYQQIHNNINLMEIDYSFSYFELAETRKRNIQMR